MVTLKRLDRLVGELDRIEPRKLHPEKLHLIRRQALLGGDPPMLRLRFPPRPETRGIVRKQPARFAVQIEQLKLAIGSQQAARLGGTMEINPQLAETLQRGQGGERTVDRDARRLFPRQGSPQNEDPSSQTGNPSSSRARSRREGSRK